MRFGIALVIMATLACRQAREAARDASADVAPDVLVADPWSAVDAAARAALATEGVENAGIVIYDADDVRVFEQMYGDFAPDRRLAVASASKLVAGVVLFDLIAKGELSLDATTGAVLGWTGPGSDITLRHLLSFTSGLAPDAACTIFASRTLADCVDRISAAAIVAAPGVQFDYGSTHLHVAARMAEAVRGQDWNAIFRGVLGDPFGLPRDVLFYTQPRQANGTTNPLVAGGLRASMRDYAPILALVFHDGRFADVTVGTPELFAAQATEPFPAAVIVNSPMADAGLPYHYGLGAWLECDAATVPCPVISSPGAYGFTPWVDRNNGYYAIVALEDFQLATGIAAKSVRISHAIRAAIVSALGARASP